MERATPKRSAATGTSIPTTAAVAIFTAVRAAAATEPAPTALALSLATTTRIPSVPATDAAAAAATYTARAEHASSSAASSTRAARPARFHPWVRDPRRLAARASRHGLGCRAAGDHGRTWRCALRSSPSACALCCGSQGRTLGSAASPPSARPSGATARRGRRGRRSSTHPTAPASDAPCWTSATELAAPPRPVTEVFLSPSPPAEVRSTPKLPLAAAEIEPEIDLGQLEEGDIDPWESSIALQPCSRAPASLSAESAAPSGAMVTRPTTGTAVGEEVKAETSARRSTVATVLSMDLD